VLPPPSGVVTLDGQAEFERRFWVRRRDAEYLFARGAGELLLEVFDPERPVAFSRTTYFDTADLELYASCRGPLARRLRVREYASAPDVGEPPVATGACFLEWKESSGARRRKLRLRVEPGALAALFAGAPEAADMVAAGARTGNADDETVLEALHACVERLGARGLAPRVTTFYRRAALRSVDARLRVTLDERLLFCPPAAAAMSAGERAPALGVLARGPRVLEVKHSGEPPAWLAVATASLREEPSYSKFEQGMHAALRGAALGDGDRISVPLPLHSFIRTVTR
jgi:hypothetical protein